ncbi:cytoplasmic protein [Bacillus cereus]|uniref:Cytoplasmic protein n=1 Tax=Bacillus cereus TaxID=1396 RepID=A0AB73UFF0_BACCE|nr:DUF6434 domain-containing protein [Bacillus cereus]QHV02369.1 cytoplasmic protein [Bacillus cereus]QHV43059.1 cytoplasmic protein [Bacillus cereus]
MSDKNKKRPVDRTGNRPVLNADISLDDFTNYYWLKKELVDFCRVHGIDSSGWKLDISKRIEIFIETGEVIKKDASQTSTRGSVSRPKKNKVQEPLSVDTVITREFKRNKEVSAFFKSVIGPRFHYTVRLNKWFRENMGKTFQDAINEWLAEEEEKRLIKANKLPPPPILPQCEYNQFIRDFLHDNKDEGYGFKDAVSAWKVKKTLYGDNKYRKGDVELCDKNRREGTNAQLGEDKK